jgi:hypothetical protein
MAAGEKRSTTAFSVDFSFADMILLVCGYRNIFKELVNGKRKKDHRNQGSVDQNRQGETEYFKAVLCTDYLCGESGNYESGDGRGPIGQEKYLHGKRQNRGHAVRVCHCGISS